MQTPEFTVNHIGINAGSRKEAEEIVFLFEKLFMQKANTKKKGSPFAGKQIEVVPEGPGTHGHIAFQVDDMDRAIAYLEENGTAIAHETAKRRDNGNIYVIYLKEEIAGFAIQLFYPEA